MTGIKSGTCLPWPDSSTVFPVFGVMLLSPQIRQELWFFIIWSVLMCTMADQSHGSYCNVIWVSRWTTWQKFGTCLPCPGIIFCVFCCGTEISNQVNELIFYALVAKFSCILCLLTKIITVIAWYFLSIKRNTWLTCSDTISPVFGIDTDASNQMRGFLIFYTLVFGNRILMCIVPDQNHGNYNYLNVI